MLEPMKKRIGVYLGFQNGFKNENSRKLIPLPYHFSEYCFGALSHLVLKQPG